MTGIKVRENVPVSVVRIVHGHFDALTRRIRILFKGEAMILVEDRFAEFAAVRLGDLYFPGVHWSLGVEPLTTDKVYQAAWDAPLCRVRSARIFCAKSCGTS